MELSLLLYIVIFIAVVVLIFKIIKKVALAIFTVFFLIFLIVAGIGGLIYLDYKSIMEQDSYEVNMIYGLPENGVAMGVSIPIENNSMNSEGISSIDISVIDETYLKREQNEGIYVVVSREAMGNILDENETYYIQGTENLSIGGYDIETGLTKDEVLEILDSNDSNGLYVETLLEKNDLPKIPGVDTEKFFTGSLEQGLDGKEINEVLFLSVLAEMDKQDTTELIENFKDDEVQIYPEKFIFSFLKAMPIDTMLRYMPDANEVELNVTE